MTPRRKAYREDTVEAVVELQRLADYRRAPPLVVMRGRSAVLQGFHG
jgi:hypothetical protein